jgi:hypothetical protein
MIDFNSKLKFETKPRWPGAPKICLFENLPSFPDKKAASKFIEMNHPSNYPIGPMWSARNAAAYITKLVPRRHPVQPRAWVAVSRPARPAAAQLPQPHKHSRPRRPEKVQNKSCKCSG